MSEETPFHELRPFPYYNTAGEYIRPGRAAAAAAEKAIEHARQDLEILGCLPVPHSQILVTKIVLVR